MSPEVQKERIMARCAARLESSLHAYTRKNLFFDTRRALGPGASLSSEEFDALLARRLARGPLPGLLLRSRRSPAARPLPTEWDAYFPATILLVDRPAIVDLFVSVGAHVHARVAVVCIDGSPAHVVDWLCRGLRAGWRAPLGFLHDAASVVYPFGFEPLKTMVSMSVTHGEALHYADLGLPRRGLCASEFPFSEDIDADETILELEAIRPSSLIAHSVRLLLSMLTPDPMMAPLDRAASRSRPPRSTIQSRRTRHDRTA